MQDTELRSYGIRMKSSGTASYFISIIECRKGGARAIASRALERSPRKRPEPRRGGCSQGFKTAKIRPPNATTRGER